MIDLGPATNEQMVLAFVRAEIDSSRFGRCYRDFLEATRMSRGLIDNADLGSSAENAARVALLRACRGYPDRNLFQGFPADVDWRLLEFDAEDLSHLKYANYSDWIALSGGTRRVIDGAANVQQSSDKRRVEPILGMAARLKAGDKFPELIAVREGEQDFVLLEGHARATAYAIVRPEHNLQAIVGSSPTIATWAFYPKA